MFDVYVFSNMESSRSQTQHCNCYFSFNALLNAVLCYKRGVKLRCENA